MDAILFRKGWVGLARLLALPKYICTSNRPTDVSAFMITKVNVRQNHFCIRKLSEETANSLWSMKPLSFALKTSNINI